MLYYLIGNTNQHIHHELSMSRGRKFVVNYYEYLDWAFFGYLDICGFLASDCRHYHVQTTYD